ncbi:hypothetical protein D5S17_26995 [Pseudonocardiaceae bacterium YIM PH 21723]|nr:hypothetical protein D5S17_26995 [Pseudonocardiaceae bacterium YIM PH 21723]
MTTSEFTVSEELEAAFDRTYDLLRSKLVAAIEAVEPTNPAGVLSVTQAFTSAGFDGLEDEDDAILHLALINKIGAAVEALKAEDTEGLEALAEAFGQSFGFVVDVAEADEDDESEEDEEA